MPAAILITYFNCKTEKEHRDAGVMAYFSAYNSLKVAEGTIIVAINTETKNIVHVSVAAGPCRARRDGDAVVYTGEDSVYNAHVIPLMSLRRVSIPLGEVARVCAIPAGDTAKSNLQKCTQYMKLTSPFYKGDRADAVLAAYTAYIRGLA